MPKARKSKRTANTEKATVTMNNNLFNILGRHFFKTVCTIIALNCGFSIRLCTENE